MQTETPARWTDAPAEDFDRCPDEMKDVVAGVMTKLGVPAKGEMAAGWRRIGENALVCYCRGGDKLRGLVLSNSGEPILYLPEGNLSRKVWDAVWDALVEAHGRPKRTLWKWVYAPAPAGGREKSGRLNLTGPGGGVAATVFTTPDGQGFNWYVWDRNGTGGENSQEPTIDEAVKEAEAATVRWGQFNIN